jgi:hypothetical protein
LILLVKGTTTRQSSHTRPTRHLNIRDLALAFSDYACSTFSLYNQLGARMVVIRLLLVAGVIIAPLSSPNLLLAMQRIALLD